MQLREVQVRHFLATEGIWRSVAVMNGTVFSILTVLAAGSLLLADESPVRSEATDFLRVDEDDRAARLQASVTRYEKNGTAVDLLGAVHIADQAYYDDLNRRFGSYDALLFEMIGGEKLVDGKIPEPAEGDDKNSVMAMLGNIYGVVSRFLKLTDQKSAIDYSKKNFVHADLTFAEFTQLQKEKGESLLSFALDAGNQAAKDGQDPTQQPNMNRLVTAFLAGNSNAIKMELIHSLGQGDDQIAAFAGDSVIISDRNAKCLRVLEQQLEMGRRNCGIFYGAAHYPDMEKRLLEKGFKKTRHEWITAWEVPKPKASPADKEESDADRKKRKKRKGKRK